MIAPLIRHGRIAALALAAAMVLPACATLGSQEDPVQLRLDDLDARLGRIERVVTNQSLVELSQRIDALQAEVRQLRGQTEETANAQQTTFRQQRDLYADIDRRLAALEGRVDVSRAAAPTGGAAVSGGADAQRVYGRAFDALKAGDYAAAISGFEAFLAASPQHPLADNAQYWLGQAFYVNRNYDGAAAAFGKLISQWPDSAKAPDGMLKLALAQFELKQPGVARQTLQKVVTNYAGTDAARQAQERLSRPVPR